MNDRDAITRLVELEAEKERWRTEGLRIADNLAHLAGLARIGGGELEFHVDALRSLLSTPSAPIDPPDASESPAPAEGEAQAGETKHGTADPLPPTGHRVWIADDDNGWRRGNCICGWTGPRRSWLYDASLDARVHEANS